MCANDETDQWYQVGVMIWGQGCALKNKYGVYASVASANDTIEKYVKGKRIETTCSDKDWQVSNCSYFAFKILFRLFWKT